MENERKKLYSVNNLILKKFESFFLMNSIAYI